jgi:superfamily II DNA or RNA helicase
MVIFKKHNNSHAKVIWQPTPEDPYKQSPYVTLDNLYAIRPEGFMFDPRFKANRKKRFSKYDGKVRLYKILPSLIPLGLVREAVRTLRQFGWNVEVDNSIISSFTDPTDYSELITSFCNAIAKSCGLTPRDYQQKILELSLKLKRAAFRAATGAGKSLAMYMIVRFFRKVIDPDMNFLILVPNINLVNQLYRNFRDDYGWADIDQYVGMYHSDFTANEKKIAIRKPILISTWQSMGSLLENPKFEDYFKRFSCLLVDELHTAKNDQAVINKVVSACSNAEYRFGLTGTIPRHILNQKVLIGNFADIHQIISSKELIERGELSKASIIEVQIPYDNYTIELCRKKKIPLNAEYELSRLTRSHEYAVHSLIRDGIITKDQNTLILMKYVENKEVENMVEMLKKHHPEFKIRFAHGKVAVKTRDAILAELESESGMIVVATYATFGTGFNMKNLHNVIFSSDCKSYTKILQSIGRSLRLHKSKLMARIFDLHHMIEEKYFSNRAKKDMEFRSNLSNHFYQREEFYYEEEYPQEIHIIDREFSFNGLTLDGVDISYMNSETSEED